MRAPSGTRRAPLSISPILVLSTPPVPWQMQAGTEAEREDAALRCRVTVEELSPGGQPRRRRAMRSAELSLGRNERRELLLRLQPPGPSEPPRCFPLRAARLFTRFAATGRSALRVPGPGASPGGAVQLLLSDCPPERLRRFLRTLRLKLAAAPGPAPASSRAQLLGPRPRDFVTVSPVQPEELRRAAAARGPDSARAKAATEPSTVSAGNGLGGRGVGGPVGAAPERPRKGPRAEKGRDCRRDGRCAASLVERRKWPVQG